MDEHLQPPRVVGKIGATLMNINGMIGAGIFALPALLYAESGDFAPWMFLVFGLFFSCSVLVAARLAAMFRSSGGHQLYAQAAFGPTVGFQVGWLLVIAMAVGRAATFHVMVSYLAVFFPALDGPVARPASVLVLLCTFSGLTLSGMRNAVGGLCLGTILKLAPILALCLVAFAQGGISVSVKPPGFSAFESVAVLVYFAFSGATNAAYSAGEVKHPRRMIPLSMLLSLAVIVVLYMAVQMAYAAAGAPGSAGDATPLAAAAGALVGQPGVIVLTLAAIFSIATNALAFFISGPRVLYGMAGRGLLPATLAHISPRFLTPDRSILAFTAIVAIVSLSGAFQFLAAVLALATQIVTLSMYAAFVLFALRRREGLENGLTPFWMLVVTVGVGFVVYVCLQVPRDAFILLVPLILAGSMLYLAARRGEVAQPVPIVE